MRTYRLNEGTDYYTNMHHIFQRLGKVVSELNWLMYDIEINDDRYGYDVFEKGPYCWISGEDMMEIMADNPDVQWIWGHLMGFKKEISTEYAVDLHTKNVNSHDEDWYNTLWLSPEDVKHPLSEIDIIAYDSSETIVMTDKESISDSIKRTFSDFEELR